jgi:hypothetical protein
VGEFTYLINDIAWLFLQRIPINVLTILLIAELWSVIFGTMQIFMYTKPRRS